MKVKDAHFTRGYAAFYVDDQAAIKAGARQDGFVYCGAPLTRGFESVRQCGECISVMLELEDGQIAYGDCAYVQYSGTAGRDSLLNSRYIIPIMYDELRSGIVGRTIDDFRTNAEWLDNFGMHPDLSHKAIHYGMSQALLDAAAKARKSTMTEVVCDEWGLDVSNSPLPLFGQSGDDRYAAVDKMILKRVAALPHGLINNVSTKLGETGGKLAEYVSWLSHRIRNLRDSEKYDPALHIDVYGTIGIILHDDAEKIADYLSMLEHRAAPFRLYIEGPVDAGSKRDQIALLRSIREALLRRNSTVRIVADEWCNTLDDIKDFADAQCCDMVQIKTPDLGGLHNTIEAILYCKARQVEAYQGGSCNETDVSARVCTHVAMATQPDRVLVKPGMGFDEGMTIVSNEMNRVTMLLKNKEATRNG